jgi:hypothetical protein
MTESEILDDYPELQHEDCRAVYEFAASLGRRVAWRNFIQAPRMFRNRLILPVMRI